MADTQTTHFNLVKPQIFGSDDTWGNKLNSNFDIIDGALNVRPVQQSSLIDTTSGRALLTGAFGLGGLTALRNNQNFSVTDNSIPTGIYRYDSTGAGNTGGPGGATHGSIIHLRRASSGGETQIFYQEAGRCFLRSRVTGGWTPWQEIYHTGIRRSDEEDDARFTQRANNLSDLASASTARGNLGLGTAALQAVGTGPTNIRDNQSAEARYFRRHVSGHLDFVPVSNISTTANSIPSGVWAYSTAEGHSGGPSVVTHGTLYHMRRAVGGGEHQIIIADAQTDATGRMWVRGRLSGGWTDWRELIGVGDFGIGLDADNSGANFNDFVRTGFTARFAPSNGPTGGGWGLMTIARAADRQAQIALNTDASEQVDQIRFRQRHSGGWSPWRTVITEHNLGNHLAEMSFGAVGTYAFAGTTADPGTLNPGTTRAGSALFPAGIRGAGGTNFNSDNLNVAGHSGHVTALTGTWRMMGKHTQVSTDPGASLWLRIA